MMVSDKILSKYRQLKETTNGCLLLMQVGAFMQVLDDDARTVSAVTGLKLKMTGDVDAPTVIGGFPKSGLDTYIGKLARAGHSIAVAMQDENKERRITEILRVAGGKVA